MQTEAYREFIHESYKYFTQASDDPGDGHIGAKAFVIEVLNAIKQAGNETE